MGCGREALSVGDVLSGRSYEVIIGSINPFCLCSGIKSIASIVMN